MRRSKFQDRGLNKPGQRVSVQEVMRGVRDRVRSGGREQDWVRRARKSVPPHLVSGTARLRASTGTLRSAIARIGSPPPSPPTLRGRIGAVLVRVIQRLLFWYTPGVQQANNQLVDALEAHLRITEEILGVLEKTNVEVARLAMAEDRNGIA
ncbi:MAG TPA: hypothetical protein VES20_17380 [Bryobacteraceae bacterium]|nr:hypothetical protein [Bryobacteraceae bacterium]